MHRLLNGLILTPLLAEEVRMTECHAVCIGAFPAQTTVLYRSARKWPFHTTPLVTSGLHISRKSAKVTDFMENYAFSCQAVLNTKFATAAFIAI